MTLSYEELVDLVMKHINEWGFKDWVEMINDDFPLKRGDLTRPAAILRNVVDDLRDMGAGLQEVRFVAGLLSNGWAYGAPDPEGYYEGNDYTLYIIE